MELVELVIVACMLKEPEHCETFRIPFEQETTVAQCAWQSQMHAVRWVEQHPDWAIKRFVCDLPSA